ncbi:MAG: hypothetical protein ACOCV1_04280 [Bacillota bacterium]
MSLAELSEFNRWFFYAFISIPSVIISVFMVLAIKRILLSIEYMKNEIKNKYARSAMKRLEKKRKKFESEKAEVEMIKENYKDDIKAEYLKKENEMRKEYFEKKNKLDKKFEKKFEKKVREVINDTYDLSLEELGQKYGQKSNDDKVSQLWKGIN